MFDQAKKFAGFIAVFLVGGALGVVIAPLVGQSGAGGKITFGELLITVDREQPFYDIFEEAYKGSVQDTCKMWSQRGIEGQRLRVEGPGEVAHIERILAEAANMLAHVGT